MFLFGSGDGFNLSKMSAKQIANKVDEAIEDARKHDLLEEVMGDTPDKQLQKALHFIEEYTRASGVQDFDRDSLIAFRRGMTYGMGLMAKVSDDATQSLQSGNIKVSDSNFEDVRVLLKKFMFMFAAIDRGLENWTDDHWFQNFMKNVKVAPEPTPVAKTKAKKITKPKKKPKKS